MKGIVVAAALVCAALPAHAGTESEPAQPKYVSLFAVMCSDGADPGSCRTVEVLGPNGDGPQVLTTIIVGEPPVLLPLSYGACLGHEGQSIALDFMRQHPTYARPEWHLQEVRCRWGNKPPKPEGVA